MTPSLNVLQGFDTTNFKNWGARSASLAMGQLLREQFATVEAIPGRITEESFPVGASLAPSKTDAILRRQHYRIARAWWALEEALGARRDIIGETPDETARLILNHQHELPKLSGVVEQIEAADTLVVDGDGDMVFRAHVSRYLPFMMSLIELAVKLNTPVHYVNSIVADCSLNGRNVELAAMCARTLRKCTSITVRDLASEETLADIAPDLSPGRIPDSLFSWFQDVEEAVQQLPARGDFIIPHGRESVCRLGALRFDEPYVVVSGGSRAAWSPKESATHYTKLVEALRTLGYPVYLAPTCRGDVFLHAVARKTGAPVIPLETSVYMGMAAIANARLFVSGRYHPSIMAGMGGTPSIFLEADSRKALSLQELLGYAEPKQFSAAPSPVELDALLKDAKRLLAAGTDLRDHLRSHAEKQYRASLELPKFIHEATIRALGRTPCEEASAES